MGALIFLFWVMCNGRLTAEIAVFGLFISVALYLFLWKFLDYKPRYDWLIAKNLPLMLLYAAILVLEIAKANRTMAGYIFSARRKPDPVIVTFRAPLTTNLGRILLANSITLTPGTITVSMSNGVYRVHCYDRSLAEGLDSSVFVRTLRKLEAGMR